MKNELAPNARLNFDPIIGEYGFAAILRNDDGLDRNGDLERDLGGIIGGPRVNPTSSGLWIEDSLGAAIAQITIAVLDGFALHEGLGEPSSAPLGCDGESARRFAHA